MTRPFNIDVLSDIQPCSQTSSKIERALATIEDSLDADLKTTAQRRKLVAKAIKAGKILYSHVLSFDEHNDRHNPALVDICRRFLLDLEACTKSLPNSEHADNIVITLVDDWSFQNGTMR